MGTDMKTYNEIITTRAGNAFVDVAVTVNVPTPKELQATTQGGAHYVVVSNFGEVFSVSLFKNGEVEPVYGKSYSGLSRKDAIINAAEWLVNPYQ